MKYSNFGHVPVLANVCHPSIPRLTVIGAHNSPFLGCSAQTIITIPLEPPVPACLWLTKFGSNLVWVYKSTVELSLCDPKTVHLPLLPHSCVICTSPVRPQPGEATQTTPRSCPCRLDFFFLFFLLR